MNSKVSSEVSPEAVAPGGESLNTLYREHGEWLRNLIGRRFRMQPADADDIVQEAYIRLARSTDAPVEKPRALLSRIALNLFRDQRRRAAVRTAHAASLKLVPPLAPVADAMAEQEMMVEIERLVVEMPVAWRDVFVLSRFRQMTNQQIADHLGLSIKTVEWRMSKALDHCVRRLRD